VADEYGVRGKEYGSLPDFSRLPIPRVRPRACEPAKRTGPVCRRDTRGRKFYSTDLAIITRR
jgi:hypothetical protein